MSRRDDRVYLHHILDAIAQIQEYTFGISRQEFSGSRLIQDGVIRELEIIGEASSNLSQELRGQHGEIPWGDIIGMRNRIVHVYFDMDLDAVWDAVQIDIPALKIDVERILGAEAQSE